MKALVTGAFPLNSEREKQLEAFGLEITFHKDEWTAVNNPEQYEIVICNGLFTYQDIRAFTRLRYIQLTSAGYDRVPMDYIREHDIAIFNAAGVYSIPMAEFALGGVLQLYKQFSFFRDNQRHHLWQKHRGLLELSGKTVCILGCGSVGSECASRFEAFGCRVLGLDIDFRSRDHFHEVYPMSAMMEVLSGADIAVLTLPLTNETRGLFSAETFSAMKKGSVLVNISRGAIVESVALADALRTHLGGAVLDVFEEEPLDENSPLWDMEHVIITPHNSFVGEGNFNRITALVMRNLEVWRQL